MEFKKDLVSVIIPVYNVEKYIEKCLITVVNQTYKNLEIIVVNDGTKDNSMDIVEKYKDDRFVIINQENKGLSGARNAGLDVATGEFVKFVDSDDYMSLGWIEEGVKEIKRESDLDCIINSNICYREEGKEDKSIRIYGKQTKYITKDDIRLPNIGGVWTCLYKRKFIEEHGLRFFEGLTVEDEGFQICAYPFINKAKIYRGKNIIYYIQRNDSIMGEYRGKNLLQKDVIDIIDRCADFYIKNNIDISKIKWEMLFIFVNDQENLLEYLIKSKSMLDKYGIDISSLLPPFIITKYFRELNLNCEFPLLSIIIPTYNSAPKLMMTLNSVYNQMYQNLEIIVIDDGSTDETKKVVEEASKKMDIKYYYKENGGVSSARNMGIEKSTGEYIYFLDSDDEIGDSFIGEMIRIMSINEKIDVVYGTNIIYGNRFVGYKKSNLQIINKLIDPKKEYFISDIGFGSSIIKRSIIVNNGIRFDESEDMFEDMLFFNYLTPYVDRVMLFHTNSPFIYNIYENKKIEIEKKIKTLDRLKNKIKKFYKNRDINKIYVYKKLIRDIKKNLSNNI